MQSAVSAGVNGASCTVGREEGGEGLWVLTSFSTKQGFQLPLQNGEADVYVAGN